MLPRLLILSLLIPAFVSPVAAQSSPDKSPLSSWLPLNGSAPPQEFHLRVPALSQNALTNQLQSPLLWEGLNVIRTTPGAIQSVNPAPLPIQKLARPHCRARAERSALLHNSKLSLHSRPPEFGLNKVCRLFHLPTRHSISLERRSKRASTVDIRVDKRHSLRSFHLPIAPGQERTSRKLQ